MPSREDRRLATGNHDDSTFYCGQDRSKDECTHGTAWSRQARPTARSTKRPTRSTRRSGNDDDAQKLHRMSRQKKRVGLTA